MDSILPIGKRLNYLRKRARFSQLELETSISAAPGSISRIENGKVNPTKETIDSISHALSLNSEERAYLMGAIPPLPSEKEISEAIESVEEYFNKPDRFAYLLDDRSRFIYVSQGFKRLFKLSGDDISQMRGTHILEMILNPELPVRSKLDKEKLDDFFRLQAARQASDVQLYKNELWFQEMLERLKTYPGFKPEYLEVEPHPSQYLDIDARSIWFDFGGVKIKTIYSREYLREHPRFVVIEHMIANPVVSGLMKLISKVSD